MADWNLTWEGPLGEDQPVDDLASLLLHFKELQPDQTPMVSLAHFLASDDRAAAMPPALAAELIANGVLGDAAEILAMEAAQPVVARSEHTSGREGTEVLGPSSPPGATPRAVRAPPASSSPAPTASGP